MGDDPSLRIKAKARDLGFDKVGIAGAGPLLAEAPDLHEWLNRGYQAGMNWMNRNPEKRLDPTLVLPGAQSIIMVAMNYFVPIDHSSDPATGKISRYAWGTDYHEVLTTKLEDLLQWMKAEFPATIGRVYVDTGPVMEKTWAERAGIGWQGKHTNVITRDLGSWVFLGEIITTLPLAPDEPETDHCGTCTLCIEACPTRAIVEPYVVDSNKCLSYLTIEHRGSVEGEITQFYDGWIYGCDVCQDVCPWNHKFSEPTCVQEFSPREGNVAPNLGEWEHMTRDEYDRRFQGSPIQRAKYEGLIRNVRIVREAAAGKDPPAKDDASNNKNHSV